MSSPTLTRWRRLFQSVWNRYQPICLSPNRGLWSPRAVTHPPLRSWFFRICGISGGGVLLSAIPCVPINSHDKPSVQSSSASLQSNAGSLNHRELVKNAAAIAVDSSCILLTHAALAAISLHKEYAEVSSPSLFHSESNAGSLSHRELVKNAAAIAVDSSCILLTHASLAAISLHKEYAEMVNILKLLLEEHGQFVGPPSHEDDLWQDIIRQRVEIEDKLQAIEDASVMLTSAILVIERAAEAAYQADAELSALTAGQHLQLVQAQLNAARKVSQKAKEELTYIQALAIRKEGDRKQDGSLEDEQS